LSGGPVSGHTALAFFLATTLFLAAPHPLVALLAICLALLVPQSRLEAGIHSGREVIWGALLGMGVPLFLAVALPWLLRAGPAWGGRGS
jgi:diacylglycerol kinase (ATP)